VIELQRKLIGDSVRNTALYDALKEVITLNSEVIDLGSGTGFLAFLCSRLGAKHITCIESDDIIAVSKQLAKRNGIKNCTFINKHSTQIKELPKADVIVSETLGNYALEESIIESIEDAKRFLKPDGVIIPRSIRQCVAPVTSDRIAKLIDIWDAGFNLSLDEAREISLQNMYVKTLKKEDLFATSDAIRPWDNIDFTKKNASVRTGEEVWTVQAPTTFFGFALWWEAHMTKNVTLSTSPLKPATHWEQIYLPLLTPVVLKKNESCRLELRSDTRWQVKINLAWTVKHLSASGKVLSLQELDMQKGYL
jgi:protein arginine N-methyltransferase 1